MAGNIGDLQVSLSANTSQMERDVSAALKRLESKGFNFGAGINAKAFTQPLGRITGASNEFQKSLDASNARVIAFGASAGAIYTIQKAFTSLISSTIEVQKSLTDINVILGASQKTLGQFGDKLFEIAKNSGQAFSTVATAAGELARQGLTVEQTLKRTSDALVLARLSGLDAASSVEALTASINSFNSSALDSTQIVNKLASVDAAFAVSSADLAEALKRVGSSAQDVGVSFDELLAIVASVNQTTARGGAVIGNSLKTIFTRVQRTEVLDQLEALGIAVRDLNGNAAPAIQVLTGLAGKFDELGSAQKSQVAELVGGVFQINILKAALGDLSKQYSVYGNALKISQGATDEATRRNEELNKTLSALLNRTLANLTKVGSDIGSLSFAPAIEKVLGGINTALESFDIKGDSIGGKIGKGIFEGIGSFVSGPGLALLIGVFIKIFGNLAKFTTDAVRTVLGLNKEAQAQAQIQERINNILAQNPQLIQNILNKQVSLLQVEKDILTVIQAQSQARQQSTAIATSLTRGLISKGVSSEKGVITARTKSQGFIPNFSANREIMGAIAGGYMPGNIRSMNIPNYGRVTYNDAETVKQFSGLSQPGIMPPANSDAGKAYKEKFKNKYGINPYASSGFVPNFAGERTKQIYPYVAVKSTDRKALSKQFKASEEADASKGYEKATEKGNIVNSRSIDRYGYIYPSFSQSSPGRAVGISSGNKYGFTTYPFPGSNFDINENLYETVRQNLINISSDYFKQLITQPKILDTTRFKTNISSNLSRSAVESSLGQVFEAGIKSSISSLSLSETANFDLNKSELSNIQQKFKLPYGGFGNTYLADLKNSLSEGNLNSMAGKISTASGEKFSGQDTIRAKKTQSRLQKDFTKQGYEKLSGAEAAFVRSGKFKNQGFIPNFSPLDRALNTEEKMGGRGVLDFKPGLGLYVRDGKTQPNFAAVMRDHPEGIGNAVQNSKKMQGMMSAGFIPNFAGFDPMTLFFAMQGMGGNQAQSNYKVEEQRLGAILNERGRVESEILALSKNSKKNRAKLNELESQKTSLLKEETSQRQTLSAQTPVFARKGGSFVGGVGGVAGRAFSRYGTGLALGAPLIADTASQFIGNENTAGGRATKAGISGLGTTASYAGLGFAVGGPMGAAIGGGIGGIMAAYDVFEKLNDIMPDVAKSIETSTEKFNNISAATQNLSVSLETLSSIEGRSDLDAKTRLDLRNKSETDFAKSITQLNAALPGAGDEIVDLYKKIGDTAELRQKISEVQVKAQRESKGLAAGGGLLGTTQKINDLAGEKFYDFFTSDYMKSPQEKIKGMSQRDQMSYRGYVQTGGQQLSDLFANFSKTGEAVGSVDIGKLQAAYQSGGINGIKNLVDGLVSTGAYSQLIGEELQKVDEQKVLGEYLQAWKEHQTSIEKYREALAAENAAFTQGTRSITDIQALQRQFSLPGGISSAALGNIDYSKIEQNLSVGKSQAFGDQVTNGYKQLSQELGYGADRIKYLSQYTQEAAEIQKDFNNGIITSSQAFERLKLSIDKIEFGKNSQYMFSDERASARQGLMERSLKQGNFKEGFDPLTSFFDKFGDNAATTADKINKSFANLAGNLQGGFEDAFGAFVDGTKTADQAFQDMLLSISQQIIKEQFSIGMRSLLGGLTGGGGYGEQGGGGGLLSSIFGGILGKANGGIIKKYSSGGSVNGGSGVRDDVPAMLTDGEYVLRKSAVNKYGKGMLDMLNQGGMVKGYAGGGSINTLLNNSYDFYGTRGEKLTDNYMPEAFKTTVNAPSELGNVPALTGRFNISDMLSSRALMDENNPMNALRTQRFLGMQGYQEQVSNFKTGYNEQYRQVEEQRKEAQRQADEINKQRMDQYNRQRTGTLIGGLINVGFSALGAFGSSFGGGGGGGGGLGGVLGGLQGIAGAFVQGLTGGGGGGGTPTMSDYQKAQIAKQQQAAITGYQYGGFGGMDFSKQTNLFPQFGSQGGFGGGMSGNNFGPSSSIGGFQFGVGLGAPAGFQTYTQNAKQDYLMNFASPVAPTAPGRGNLVYDFLNQNSNPFGYSRGYAKGGVVKGYEEGGKVKKFAEGGEVKKGGYVKVEFDKSAGQGKMLQGSMNFYDENDKLVKSFPVNSGAGSLYPSPEGDFSLSNLRTRNQNETKGAYYSGGIGFTMDVKNKENYNKETLLRTDSEGKLLLANYIPEMRDTNKDGTVSNKETFNQWKTAVENNDFMFDTRKKMFRTEIRLHPDGGAKGSAGCIVGACPEDQQEIYKMLQTGNYKNIRVRYGQSVLNKLEENGVIAQAEPAGLRLPSENTMIAQNVQPKANTIIAGAQPVSRPALSDMFSGLRNNVKEAGGMFSNGIANIAGMGRSGMNSLGGMLNNIALPKMNIPTVAPSGGGIGRALRSSLGGLGNLAKSGYGKVYDALYNLGGTMASPFPYEKALIDFPASVNNNLSNMKIPAIGGGAGGIGGALMASLGGMKNLAGKGYDALYNLGGNAYDKFGPKPSTGPQQAVLGPQQAVLGPQPFIGPMPQKNYQPFLDPEYLKELFGFDDPEIRASIEEILKMQQSNGSPSRSALMQMQQSSLASTNQSAPYQSAGNLYDQVGLARNPLTLNPQIPSYLNKYSPFYGSGGDYFNQAGKTGFNNYMNYLGLGSGTSLSSLSSFKFPMTPTTLNPYAFSSSPFGGNAVSYGTGVASASSTYFSAGSRLGATPSWASRATGGMIYGGTSVKDDVPAMLMGGEYVIRKDAVDRFGQPFFDRLNRGQVTGFAEGGPVGTSLPSVGGGGANQQDNSRNQFVESITKLVKSLEQLNKGIEEQNRGAQAQAEGGASTSDSTGTSGVTNNINISVNVDQNGKTTDSTKQEDQNSGTKEETDQEKFKKTMERSRVLAELLRQQVLKVIVEEQRPGGVLYQGSKGRDMGR